MHFKLLFGILFLSIFGFSQQASYPKEEIRRLGDLGRLWGAINYFHPEMGTGNVSTDKLALEPIAILLADRSAEGFKKSVRKMLEILGDKSTVLVDSKKSVNSRLFLQRNQRAAVHRLQGNKWYIALPTSALEIHPEVMQIPGMMPDSWDSASSIILDIRNLNDDEAGNYSAFLYEALPLLVKKLAGGKKLPELFERNIYHNGFVPQTDGSYNIYNSGWTTSTKGSASEEATAESFQKPFGFVIDHRTSGEIVKRLMTLREAGVCKVFFESNGTALTKGNNLPLELSDGVTVSIRYSDYIVTGNKRLPEPDLAIDQIKDSSVNGSFVNQLFDKLQTSASSQGQIDLVDMQFILAKPSRFSEDQLPTADKRLFGLYNWWNAIQYFSPYKELIPVNWDSILYKYIPVMLDATDSLKYILAVRSMVSEIKDSHGFIGTVHTTTPIRRALGYWPALQLDFIGEKLFITEIGKDSSTNVNGFRIWDEIVSIDGKPVNEVAEKFRYLFASSNEATFKRDVTGYLINGPINTKTTLGLLRDGKPLTMEVARNGRHELTGKNISFNDNYKVLQMLPGNIGYVNMGALPQNLVDSMFRTFAKSPAIIFDIRNYPKGTAWTIAPRLGTETKQAVMFDKPFVDYNYLMVSENKGTLKSYFTVTPNKTFRPYTGKVIILCNERTQSQAEYSIMMFQGARKVTVIGSQTAGADGNVTNVVIPGGYTASFSGLGIYYPDGTGTQRTGIKIDIESVPTLAGLKANKDEVLERALQFIKTGK